MTPILLTLVLLAADPQPERMAGPMHYTEGPTLTGDGSVYFTEAGPAHSIHRFDPETGDLHLVLDATRSGGANGIEYRDGKLYVCEDRINRAVSVFDEDLNRTLLAETFEGNRFNGPNDLAIDDRAGVYFTDPKYGKKDYELDHESVYYIDPEGNVHQVIDDLERPNGIALSLDGTRLYVADNKAKKIHVYPVNAPGELGEAELFHDLTDLGGPDGMDVAPNGTLGIAIFNGNLVMLNGEGERVLVIDTPRKTSNLDFAPDGSLLYFTSDNSLFRLELETD